GIRIRLDKRRTAKQRVMRMLAAEKRHDAAARAEAAKAAADAAVEVALDPDLEAEAEELLDDAAADEFQIVDEEGLGGGSVATLHRVKRRFPFHTDDLRYKHVEVDTKEESNAAVICI